MEFSNISSPYRLSSVDELPTRIQQHLWAQLSDDESPLYLCVMPRERSWLQMVLGISKEFTFFVLTPKQVMLIHDTPKGQEVQACRVDELTYFEAGMILLNSWFKAPPSVTTASGPIYVRYNSVFEREFHAAILYLRKLTLGLDLEIEGVFSEMPGEPLLQALPIKFNNVSRRYWLRGEAALSALLVPVIRTPYLRYFRRVYSFATAIILTNWQVLLVIEQGSEGSAGKYGQAWLFCPLSHIATVSLDDTPAYGLRALRLELQAGSRQDTVEAPYPPEMEGDFQRFVEAVRRARERLT